MRLTEQELKRLLHDATVDGATQGIAACRRALLTTGMQDAARVLAEIAARYDEQMSALRP